MKGYLKRGSHLLLAGLLVLAMPLLMGAVNPEDNGTFLNALNPYVCVTGYEVEKGSLEAGSSFVLRVDIKNVSPKADAYNIMVSYFFPGTSSFNQQEGETNQRFIEHLAAGKSTSVRLNLQVTDAPASTVVYIQTNFAYLNANGVAYSNQTNFSVHQQQKTALAVGSFGMVESAKVNERTLVSVQFTNSGQTDVSHIVMTLKGDFRGSPMTFQYDALAAEEKKVVDTYVYFSEAGEKSVSATFTYENEVGDSFTLEEPAHTIEILPLTAGSALDSDSLLQNSIQGFDIFSTRNFWFFITVATGIVVLLAIAWLTVSLVRGRKE